MRWLVERKSNDFDDVGADTVEVRDGCLIFRSATHPEFIIAAGQWVTVVGEED